jgi:hypothetical protein
MDLSSSMLANLPVPHEDGSFVSERVSRLVEIIRDYDRNIDVRWIPPSQRAADDPAFALVTKDTGGREYVIFYIQDESKFDGGVLERLYQMDAAKHGNILTKIETENMAVKAIQEKLHKERLEEAHDVAYHIQKSSKNYYRHNGFTYEGTNKD